jgi:tRNA threonylcarbamoyladenosine biosynthesis protein TsaB
LGGRRHAEQLVPAIASLRASTGVGLDQLAAIAVGVGPGLFTGLRVGVTTATVMAQALQVPVVAVPSLDLVAYPLRYANRTVVAVLDARRHEVFHASYRPVPGGVQRIDEYAVGSIDALIAELEASGASVLVAGDGVDGDGGRLAQLDRVELAGPDFARPSVSALVELAIRRVEREEFDLPWNVRPLYLRPSDAEQALSARLAASGGTKPAAAG